MTTPHKRKWCTLAEAPEYLGISAKRTTLYNMMKKGKFILSVIPLSHNTRLIDIEATLEFWRTGEKPIQKRPLGSGKRR